MLRGFREVYSRGGKKVGSGERYMLIGEDIEGYIVEEEMRTRCVEMLIGRGKVRD